jgi:hypothetical protein
MRTAPTRSIMLLPELHACCQRLLSLPAAVQTRTTRFRAPPSANNAPRGIFGTGKGKTDGWKGKWGTETERNGDKIRCPGWRLVPRQLGNQGTLYISAVSQSTGSTVVAPCRAQLKIENSKATEIRGGIFRVWCLLCGAHRHHTSSLGGIGV